MYRYPQLTYWTGFVKVFLDQRSHIPAMALFQASILHSSTGTSHSSALSTNSRILFNSSQDWPIFLFDKLRVKPGQHNSLVSPWYQCTWLIFYELWVNSTLGSASGVRLGRVHWNTIWMVGWALSLLLIVGWYQAFSVLMFLSGLVPLCLWIHFALLCTQGFAIPMNYIFVLRDTD